MSKQTVRVQIYLPGDSEPTPAGLFVWDGDRRVGQFAYDKNYLDAPRSFAIDPDNLPLRKGTFLCLLNQGIFGVFRDAGPDTWGRGQLTRMHGSLNELEVLCRSSGDGVGALVFGEQAPVLQPYTLSDIDLAARNFPPDEDALYNAIHQTTSMGGAKPKLLVKHDGGFWIAKFPEKSDPARLLAINEHVALEMARACGIAACESRIHRLPDGRNILLVKRFDLLDAAEGKVTRLAYASAHTLLGLGNPNVEQGKKSYRLYYERMRRWSGAISPMAIWQRVVLNALIGNIDDHPRNHGIIRSGDGWGPSPAFDLVAFPRSGQFSLSMNFHSKGAMVSQEALLDSAAEFGVPADLARDALRSMATTITNQWEQRYRDNGATDGDVEWAGRAFSFAHTVELNGVRLD